MDSKKDLSKNKSSSSQSQANVLRQQQMALASQMGIPPAFLDPNLLGGKTKFHLLSININASC